MSCDMHAKEVAGRYSLAPSNAHAHIGRVYRGVVSILRMGFIWSDSWYAAHLATPNKHQKNQVESSLGFFSGLVNFRHYISYTHVYVWPDYGKKYGDDPLPTTQLHADLWFKWSSFSSVPDAKREREVKTIGTHSGRFNCDEVLACYMLKVLPEYKDARYSESRHMFGGGGGGCNSLYLWVCILMYCTYVCMYAIICWHITSLWSCTEMLSVLEGFSLSKISWLVTTLVIVHILINMCIKNNYECCIRTWKLPFARMWRTKFVHKSIGTRGWAGRI